MRMSMAGKALMTGCHRYNGTMTKHKRTICYVLDVLGYSVYEYFHRNIHVDVLAGTVAKITLPCV